MNLERTFKTIFPLSNGFFAPRRTTRTTQYRDISSTTTTNTTTIVISEAVNSSLQNK